MEITVGDRVLCGKWAGTDVVIEGEELLILKQSDILGVIEDKSRARAKAA
jgi:chaperonin GroES